jgi:hypothetical protein
MGLKPTDRDVSRLGSRKPGAVHPTRRLQLSAHERKQSLELELEAKRGALQHSHKEKAAAENDKAQLIRDPTNQLLRLLSKSQGPA